MIEGTILHSDMNSFYASVEMMLDPSLRKKAVAVCGSADDRHGIVLAKSDLAKKSGVKTGMVNWEARKLCPELVIVPPQYDEYLKFSRLAHEIYDRYTDLVEPFGMDECWLDVHGSKIYGSGMEIAEKIRQSVKEELGLTVSIGVSFNKIFAKLGSDMKKPDAITQITRDNFRQKVWPLAASELLYVGCSTARTLSKYGIHTTGVQISIRGNDFITTQYQCKLPIKTQLPSEIAKTGFRLFQERYHWTTKVRAVTIRAIDLAPAKEPEQLTMFIDHARREKRVRMEDAVEEIRRRFGPKSITCASLLGDLKIPSDGREKVRMPGMITNSGEDRKGEVYDYEWYKETSACTSI